MVRKCKAYRRGVNKTDSNKTISMFPDLASWPAPASAPDPKSSSTIVVLQSLRSPAAPIIHDEAPPITPETAAETMRRLNWAAREKAISARRAALTTK
jgi:hypothetical protein